VIAEFTVEIEALLTACEMGRFFDLVGLISWRVWLRLEPELSTRVLQGKTKYKWPLLEARVLWS